MVTVVIPAVVLWLTGSDTLNLRQSVLASRVGLPILGGALIYLGLVLMVGTIRLFVTAARAPWPRGTRPSGSWSGASTSTSATR